MTDITNVDIKKLLSENGIDIKQSDDKIYDKAFDLMNKKSTSYDYVPTSIIDGCYLIIL